MQVHLSVAFPLGSSTVVALHYRADPPVAAAFAADMRRLHNDVLITVDRAVTSTMRLLPCHQLYEA